MRPFLSRDLLTNMSLSPSDATEEDFASFECASTPCKRVPSCKVLDVFASTSDPSAHGFNNTNLVSSVSFSLSLKRPSAGGITLDGTTFFSCYKDEVLDDTFDDFFAYLWLRLRPCSGDLVF